jgi:hypothetical protein
MNLDLKVEQIGANASWWLCADHSPPEKVWVEACYTIAIGHEKRQLCYEMSLLCALSILKLEPLHDDLEHEKPSALNSNLPHASQIDDSIFVTEKMSA